MKRRFFLTTFVVRDNPNGAPPTVYLTRRNFIRALIQCVSSLLVAVSCLPACWRSPADGQSSETEDDGQNSTEFPAGFEVIDEADPLALGLGYKHDAREVDTTRFTRRSTREGKKQFCSNCKLFATFVEGYGTCTLLPKKLVRPGGWCNGWISKAS